MDGVLVDSEPFNFEIENRQFLLNGISVTDEEHRSYLGTASNEMWIKIAENHRLNLPVENLIEQNRIESIRYFKELAEIPVMPGLVELLEKLQAKNCPTAVASSSFPEIIDLILLKTGLRKYFQVVVSSQEAGKSKPEPDVFLLAAQKLGVDPENCLVIEDSQNGIKAAHAAGMRCIAFHGSGSDPEKQNGADAIIQHFSKLERLL
jgi:HAD superfamily hydrolase (TIGR01509 family)